LFAEGILKGRVKRVKERRNLSNNKFPFPLQGEGDTGDGVDELHFA